MATTDYDFTATRNDLINRAFRLTGNLGLGETLSGDELTQGAEALNTLVKAWHAEGVFLWTMTLNTTALVASTASYALGNDIIGIDRAFRVDTNDDVPVRLISYRDYQGIHDKDASGDPTRVAIDYGRSTPTLYVWPVPTGAGTLKHLDITRMQDLDTAGATPQIPQRFLKALVYGLAADLADEHLVPLQERRYLDSKARELFMKAKASDVERQDYEFVSGAFKK